MKPTKTVLLVPLAAVLSIVSPPMAARAESPVAHAVLRDASGKQVGTASLTQTPLGVLVHASLTTLPAGTHAFHAHAVGKCEPPFTSAGGHFNPTQKEHGFENPKGMHAGDMPNMTVPDSGALTVDVFLPQVTLTGGDAALIDEDGAALVVHAGADDQHTDPAGNAGDRIACGVIEAGAP